MLQKILSKLYFRFYNFYIHNAVYLGMYMLFNYVTTDETLVNLRQLYFLYYERHFLRQLLLSRYFSTQKLKCFELHNLLGNVAVKWEDAFILFYKEKNKRIFTLL